MADKKKPQKITSDRGIAVYPKLDKPDTKFKPEGVYSIKLRVSQEVADKLVEKHLKPVLDEYKKSEDWAKKDAAGKKKNGKKWKLEQADWYQPVTDDEGNETGDVTLNFKATASGKSKKDGKEWKRGPIARFDAKGKPLPKGVQVWGGSEVKVSFVPMPWLNPKGEYGVKLGLEAVQVLKLVEGGARSAEDYGFGEEEGYEADEDSGTDEGSEGSGEGGDEAGAEDF